MGLAHLFVGRDHFHRLKAWIEGPRKTTCLEVTHTDTHAHLTCFFFEIWSLPKEHGPKCGFVQATCAGFSGVLTA